jgi:5'-nucleotidase
MPGQHALIYHVANKFSHRLDRRNNSREWCARVSAKERPREEELTIIHFNDVYDIFPSDTEPVGGAARFTRLVKEYSNASHSSSPPLILFSGDCLNPSTLSAFTKGEHMVPILNHIGVHVASLGNHDFDFGVEELQKRMSEFSFPWLLSNVLDRKTGKPLAGAEEMIEMEWNGMQIGIIGLVEKEWLATIPSIDMDQDVIYLDFVAKGEELCELLLSKGCDMVIALTHMRAPNDIILASKVPNIHLILGGHDHSPQAEFVPPHGTLLLKSGTDFREFSVLKISKRDSTDIQCTDIVEPTTNDTDSEFDCCSTARDDVLVSWKRVYVTSETEEDMHVAGIVDQYHDMMGSKILSPLGWTLVDLDARFDQVRSQETSLGNLLADIMRLGMGIQIDGSLLNSGTIRSDRVHYTGQFTVKDLITMLPFTDELVVVEMTGTDLLDALEVSVSAWPAKEGRFLQVSGISYAFDPTNEPGNRIIKDCVTVNNEPIQINKPYTIATKAYLRSGKDGFETLKKAKQIIDPETAPRLVTLIHALLSRVQTLNECIESEGTEAPCQSTCSILRGTDLESLIDFDKQSRKYGVSPKLEGRIMNLQSSFTKT